MKNILHKLGTVALLSGAFLFSGCDPKFEDEIKLSAGPLDLSRYVAVGNSLTAGFGDGGLSLEGQVFSYPNILANQFSYVGGGEFRQPLFPDGMFNGSGYVRLQGFTSTGAPIVAPVTTNLAIRGMGADNKTPLLAEFRGEIQNFGIPGIRVADIKNENYGFNNPVAFNNYYERITQTSNPKQTYFSRVTTSTPTFFSLWLGNNDVLGYATAGGFAGTITELTAFTNNYTELVAALAANNTEGILATIPDVRSVPFFTTVGPTAKPLLTAAVAAARAQGLPITGVAALTKNTAGRINITPEAIKDASGGNILLTLTSSAYLPLVGQPTGRYWRELAASQNPANPSAQLQGYLAAFQIDTTKAFGLDPRNPIPSAFVLDEEEQGIVANAITAFNSVIRAQAQAKNLALFDAFQFFNSIQSGIMINGVGYSPAYITGNIFSLDGVHPTPRGYAIVANEMIRAINSKYGSMIPTIDVTKFRAVLIP